MHQSAYRKDHSTQTAVLSVPDCLLVKADERLLSDCSVWPQRSLIDTLDRSALLERLKVTFGLRGVALEWFAAYVRDRSQSVIVAGIVSAYAPLCME